MLEEEIKKELESVYALLMNLQKFMVAGTYLVEIHLTIFLCSMRVESELEQGSTFFVDIPFGYSHLPREQVHKISLAPGDLSQMKYSTTRKA
jgi:hypothetical protein